MFSVCIKDMWVRPRDTISLCHSNVAMLEAELQKITTALVEEFLEPDKNKLIRRYV